LLDPSMNNSTRHSAVFITAYIITSLLNYIFGVALSWFFNPAQFGVLGVAQSLLLLIALAVGSGFSWTTAQDFASSGINEDSRRRFRTAFVSNLFLGVSFAGLVWFAYQIGWLKLGPSYRNVIPILALTVIILAARAVLNGAARGMYQFSPVAANLVGEVVIKIIIGLGLVTLGFSVAGVLGGFVIGAALSFFHSLWITRKAHLWRGSGWFDHRVWRATAPLFIGVLGVALMLNLDILGLKLLAPPSQADQLAGIYQAAAILARTPVFLAQALTLVLFSYMAGTRIRSDFVSTSLPDGSTDYIQSALHSWFHLLLPFALALIIAPQAALVIFFPAEYQSGALALQIAALGAVILALATLLIGLLQAAGKRRVTSIAVGVAVIAQILILLWLVPHWRTYGAAISLVVSGLIALVFLIPTFKPYLLGKLVFLVQNPQKILRLILPLLAFTMPLLLIPSDSRWMAIIKFSIAGLLYMITLFSIRHQSSEGIRQPARYMLSQFVRVLLGG
jgi:O-antigen/teichoic acid export membrane protein